MNADGHLTADEIRSAYRSASTAFHALFASISEEDWRRQSLNPGWTNGEILVHIMFGFIVLNALLPMTRFWGRLPRRSSKPFAGFLNYLTGPFNWINALGARGQGKVFTYRNSRRIFDRVHASLLSKIDRIEDDEWQRGMHYPNEWDPNFREFMTLEQVFLYPIAHFEFHRDQVAH